MSKTRESRTEALELESAKVWSVSEWIAGYRSALRGHPLPATGAEPAVQQADTETYRRPESGTTLGLQYWTRWVDQSRTLSLHVPPTQYINGPALPPENGVQAYRSVCADSVEI